MLIRPTIGIALLMLLAMQTVIAEQQCVRLTQTPASYRTVEQFQPANPQEKLTIIPAVFRSVEEKITVVEAHCPGDQFRSESITVEIKPAYSEYRIIPAVYETVYIKQQTRPPVEGWILIREDQIAYEKRPERTEVKEIRQLRKPESSVGISIPAQIKNIMVRRIRQPGIVCEESARIAARFKLVEKQILESPAIIKRINIPPVYNTVTKRQIEQGGRIMSVPVACNTSGALPAIAAKLPEKPRYSRRFFFLHDPSAGSGTGENGWVSAGETAAMSARTPYRNTLPALPWPPPRGSWLFPIPRQPFVNATVMTDIEATLAPALREAGYTNQRYYQIDNTDGSRNGFAIVTQLEKWVSNGIPDNNKRFYRGGSEQFLFADYIRNLFFAPEGKYRLIMILVNDLTWSWDNDPDKKMTAGKADELLSGGASNLPEEFESVQFTPRHRVEVVIYEFKREGETVILELPGGMTTAENHFKYSGLESKLGLDGM